MPAAGRDGRATSPRSALSRTRHWSSTASYAANLVHPIRCPIALVQGDTAETVLRKEETLLSVLDALVAQRVLGGVEIAARYLPSAATQLARRSIFPEPDELAMRIAAAQEGLPFRAGALQPFIDDVAASRTMAPLLPSDFHGGLIAARLQPLLLQHGHDWYGVIAPSDLRAGERFSAAMREAGATYVDVTAEANGIVTEYTGSAWRWFGLGAVAAFRHDCGRVCASHCSSCAWQVRSRGQI